MGRLDPSWDFFFVCFEVLGSLGPVWSHFEVKVLGLEAF